MLASGDFHNGEDAITMAVGGTTSAIVGNLE